MGVSLSYITPKGRTVDLSPGWRSMMFGLLEENGLLREVNAMDIGLLLDLARRQRRGEKEPPFDWSETIEAAFYDIVKGIREYGSVTIDATW